MSSTISPYQSLIYIMVVMSAVDNQMTDRELSRIGSIVQSMPVFKEFDPEKLVHTAEECSDILSEEDGLETILKLVAQSLPERLYETAYAIAVEVAAADLSVEQEELWFLQILRDHLNLDKLTVAAIERGARARYATL